MNVSSRQSASNMCMHTHTQVCIEKSFYAACLSVPVFSSAECEKLHEGRVLTVMFLELCTEQALSESLLSAYIKNTQ